MAALKFLVVAGAALLSANHNVEADAAGNSTQAAQCAAEFNKVRQQVKLADFKEVTSEELKNPFEKDVIDDLCKNLKTDAAAASVKDSNETTYMLAPQTGAAADCAGAVKLWQATGKDMQTNPTPDASKAFSQKEVSFFGLYNTQANPTLACVVVTCKGEDKKGGQQPAATDSYSLLCATKPKAYKAGSPVFGKEQWDNIKSSVSASTAPTLALTAAAAVAAVHAFFH